MALLAGPLQAQDSSQYSVTYAENGTGPVATFTATDPEGVTPIVWGFLEDAQGEQNLGIFTDSNSNGVDDDADDVKAPDVADHGDFEIKDGVLTFKDKPDFETPNGGQLEAIETDEGGGENTYKVVVQVSDGGTMQALAWFKVTVMVTDEEEDGKVTWTVDPDGSADGTLSANELPAKPIMQFQAGATLAVNVSDDDGTPSNVRWQWYRSSSKTAQGTAISGATSATYTAQDKSTDNDVGMYLRAMATYSDARGPNKTASLVSDYPVQVSREDNAKPVFALTTATRQVTEGKKGMTVGAPVTATDADNDLLNYVLSGTAVDNFDIDQKTGQITTKTDLDFDTATKDSDGYYKLEVTVNATDSAGEDADTAVTVTITVTDLNEKPTFSEGAEMAADHMENNETLTVSTYTASDPESGKVTLSLMGDDASKFDLNDPDPVAAGSKVLAFKAKPDFEMPGDGNKDNIYEVTVRASDGVMNADRMVTVKVTDADEGGKVELSSQDALIGVELTATLTDSDGGVPTPARFTDVKWQWHILNTAAEEPDTSDEDTNNVNKGETSDSYTPVAGDRGKFLKVTATYTDRTRDENVDPGTDEDDGNALFGNTATSDATTAVRNNPANQAPKFKEGASTFRVVAENTMAVDADPNEDLETSTDNPADNVGGPIEATDADGDTPTYTLSGTGADMFRVRANGQIEVSATAKLDYETKKVHTIKVTADDGYGGSNSTATITVTIHVTGVDEAPMIRDRADSSAMGEQSVSYAENGDGPVLRLSATDPERVTPIVWGFLTDATGEQNLGIFTDSVDTPDNVDDSADDVGVDDIADHALFDIDGGVLTFKEKPDYEETDTDNEHHVVVQASDGGTMQALAWFKVTVMVTDEEEDGKVTWTVDHDGNGADTPKLMQFQAGDALEASVSDDDGATSNVRWQWYRSSSDTAQGTAISGATSATYTVTDSPADSNDLGKYLRVKATYNVASGPDETAFRVSDYKVRAARTQANIKPVFDAAAIERRVAEGKKGMTVGAPVTATDADNDLLNYVLSGTAVDNFDIDQKTGQITTKTDLDFDTATKDSDGYYKLEVTVNATDSAGEDADTAVTVTITVTDLNEKPTFSEGAEMAADHMENNETLTVSTYTASDPESGKVTLSLMGDDASKFDLNDPDPVAAGSKVLAFKAKPDFEMPGDGNKDNIYEVTVRASDGVMNADRMVTVKVTDADEGGKVTLSSQDALIGVELTATLTDSDGGVPTPARFTDVKWQWHRLNTAAEEPDTSDEDTNNVNKGETSDSYTPVAGDRGKFLKVTATYTDRTRDEDNDGTNNADTDNFIPFRNMATSDATTAVRNNPANQAPKFKEGASTFRVVAENTMAVDADPNEDLETSTDNPADNVGGPIEATDADGDTPTYTLSGADAAMFRVRSNGQIEAGKKAKLDHETKNRYMVTLTATDGSGATNNSASIAVTIHVTDVDEAPMITRGDAMVNQDPVFPAATDTRSIPAGTAAGTNIGSAVTATDADNDTLTYTLGGTDAADFDIDQATGQLMTKTALDYETQNTYTVMVTADDGNRGMDTVTVTIMVTDVEDMVTGDPLLAEYDPDGDGTIEKADMRRAVGKFFADPQGITDADMRRLVGIYFSQ